MKTEFPSTRTEDDWSAITTSNQFAALGAFAKQLRCDPAIWTTYRDRLRTRDVRRIDMEYVKTQLINSWNTERLLWMTKEQFSSSGNGFVVQWAFPQAYYAAFNSTLASFECSGFNMRSHKEVRKKVSELASRSVLPDGLNVYVDGGPNNLQVVGMDVDLANYQSVQLNLADLNNIKAHLVTFLKSTRKHYLEEKKSDVKILTKDGKNRKVKYNACDWERVSSSLGKTSWLCLFYRKRIKSTYRDIDTFLSQDFATGRVLNGLAEFVCVFNLANEINVANHLGIQAIQSWSPDEFEVLNRRIAFMSEFIS